MFGPFKSNLERLGIAVSLKLVDPSQYIKRLETHDFDITTRRFIQQVSPGGELCNYFGSESADRPGTFNSAGISDPVVDEATVRAHGGVLTGLEELLKNSDFVTLHAPLIPATEKMISEKELGLMKPDSFLINAARGPLIDEDALYTALQTGVIGGAGLDVMVENVPNKNHPLLSLDNIIITPHTAFFSQESTLELERRAAQEVVRAYKGEMPDNLVNKTILSHSNPRHNLV